MTTITRLASDKQTAFITRLLGEKDLTGSGFAAAVEGGHVEHILTTLTSKEASDTITRLMALPKQADAPAAERVEVPEGMHRVDGVIFKVQRAVHGSGNLYAKRLTQYGDDWTFEYAAGAMRSLSTDTRMTLEEAKAFGALYGTCCSCGRTLTDEGSIEAGIGPICAKKF